MNSELMPSAHIVKGTGSFDRGYLFGAESLKIGRRHGIETDGWSRRPKAGAIRSRRQAGQVIAAAAVRRLTCGLPLAIRETAPRGRPT
jgi:hypothetical protein